MSKRVPKHRSRWGAVLVVLGVVAAVMAVMPAALAHHPEITAQASCVDGAIVVSGTSRAWAGCSGDGECGNPDIRIQFDNYGGGTTWYQVATGVYNSGNGYQFSWGPVAWPAGASGVNVRAYAAANWNNGTAPGSTSSTVSVGYPTALCTGTIKVDKVTIPATGNDPNFTFDPSWSTGNFALDDNDTPYSSPPLAPGSGYSVAEVSLPSGWQLDSATCSDGSPVNNINLSAGETVTCTFTNKPQPGRIIIDKLTAPSGDAQLFNFNPSWTGDFQLADGSPVYDSGYTLAGSNYTISEDAVAGWSQASAICDHGETIGDIDPEPGETVTCTFTNSRAGTIIIDKVTVPATGDDPDFQFEADWLDISGADFVLDDNDAPASFQLPPGDYEVEEINLPSGWYLSSAVCDQGETIGDIDVAAGETVTCTFTNTKKGRIYVDKVTNPSTETDFGFEASWVDHSGADFWLDDTDTPHNSGWLTPGTYDVYESYIPGGWFQTGASCSDGSPVSAIVLDPGETVTCTFNNGLPQGEIRVNKTGGPNPVTFNKSGAWSGTFNVTPGTQWSSGALNTGTYGIAEQVPPGWSQTGAYCVSSLDTAVPPTQFSPSSIVLDPNEIVTCYFTNTRDHGHIVVEKVTEPAGSSQSFSFNGSWTSVFSLTGQTGGNSQSFQVDTGSGFSVTETLPEGWSLKSTTCPAPFSVAKDQTVTCTFTNTRDTGSIILRKALVDPAGKYNGEVFTFDVSWGDDVLTPVGGPFPWSSAPIVLPTTLTGQPGYSVAEINQPANWIPLGISCTNAAGGSENPGAIVLDKGEVVTCTATNERAPTGSLTVVKDATPSDNTVFHFAISTPPRSIAERAAMTFDLSDPGNPSRNFPGPGAYTVSELGVPTGWRFDDVVCAGAAEWNHTGQTVNVTVGRDETVFCTFYNSGYGHIIVEKDVISAGAPAAASFAFSSSYAGGFSLVDGGATAAIEVPAGVYSVAEVLAVEQIADGWALGSAYCDEGSAVSAIGVSPNETVTCTFENTYQAPPGYLRVVKVVEGAACSDFSFSADGNEAVAFDGSCANEFEFPAGSHHSVVESAASGYATTYDNCSNVEIGAGETVTCTITNTARPGTSLTIVKAARTLNTALESALFDFTGDLGSFSLASGDSQLFDVEPGTYAVTEALVDPWLLDPAPAGIVCSGASEGAVVYDQATATVSVTLAAGDNVTCTFNNYDEDTLGPELPYTGSNGLTMPLLIAGLWAVLMGLAMGVWSLMRQPDKA